MKTVKWRALIGMISIIIAVVFNIYWLWGILIFLMVVPGLRSGHTHLFEDVSRRDNPVTFWFINIIWLAFAVYMLLMR